MDKCVRIILIIILILLIYFVLTSNNFGTISEYMNSNSDITINIPIIIPKYKIPKILHQTAPADKNKWPDVWKKCQQTWFDKFPSSEYQYIMWTDEMIDFFMKKYYKWFYDDTFKNYQKNIQKVDIIRYFILYTFGGIYADMDYECINNFFSTLINGKVNIVESPFKHNENLHNCLMASPPGHPFWLTVFKQARIHKHNPSIISSTGPRLIDVSFDDYPNKEDINIMPISKYNPHIDNEVFNSPNIYSRHHLTSVWKKYPYSS